MRRPFLRPVSRLLLVALAPLALDGCVSIGVSRTALDPPPDASASPKGALAVSIYEKASERDSGRVASFPVLSELVRVNANDFASGETVAVTLDLSKLRGEGGSTGSGKVSTSFLVPVARE